MSISSGAKGEANETLRRIVGHIKSVVEEERELLASSNFDGFDRVIARKDQLAIELSRHTRRLGSDTVESEARELLNDAARALDSNATLLRRHIEAVSEVAGLICNILVNANSDGTYTGNVARRGPKP
jgi:hypothetical protein